MKKLALTVVCAMAVTGGAFAQGFINWQVPVGDLSFQTNSTTYSPLFGGGSTGSGAVGNTANVAGGFDYILLTQADPNNTTPTDANVWDGTWSALTAFGGGTLVATNGTGPTGFGKANATPGGDNGQEVTWASGVTNGVVIVGWSTDLGLSWTGVSNILAALAIGNTAPLLAADPSGANAYFGESNLGDITPNGSTPGANLVAGATAQAYGTALFQLNTQLYLIPVPEPTTLALAGLGGLGLMLFRRQRK